MSISVMHSPLDNAEALLERCELLPECFYFFFMLRLGGNALPLACIATLHVIMLLSAGIAFTTAESTLWGGVPNRCLPPTLRSAAFCPYPCRHEHKLVVTLWRHLRMGVACITRDHREIHHGLSVHAGSEVCAHWQSGACWYSSKRRRSCLQISSKAAWFVVTLAGGCVNVLAC